MKTRRGVSAWVAVLLMPLAWRSDAAVEHESGSRSFSDLKGRIVLDNDRVLVQSFTVVPGQSTGTHTSGGPELLVFVHGGVLRSESTGRLTLWKDGRVVWLPASHPIEESERNAGTTPIDFIEVTLKPVPRGPNSKATAYGYLSYPNVPGEDILDNDRVIVQHFALNPGQWEGVHAHNPNTLYIFIKGSQWLSKTTNPPSETHGDSPDGDVGWMQAYDIAAGHQSGNVGAETSDVVWIALKR